MLKNFGNLLFCAWFALAAAIQYSNLREVMQGKIAETTANEGLLIAVWFIFTLLSIALALSFGKAYFNGEVKK